MLPYAFVYSAVLSRLFEKLVYDQLYNHLDNNEHLYTFQSDFRTLHSVVTCLLKSTNDWYVHIDKSKVHAGLFIDLKKALDTVDHGILLAKLHHYGLNAIEHNWFRSYLNDRKQLCKVNSESSKIQSIEIGVPQDSCLGFLLFLLYINDLPFALREAHATIYADDTTISCSSDNMEDIVVVVKAELSRLTRWLQGNKLSPNVVKTQAMIMGSKQKLSRLKQSYSAIPRFHIEIEDIDIVNQTRYLGVIIDENLKWDSQIKNMQTKISRALGFLKYAKKYVPLATLKDIYKGIVEPNFNYCCSVWGSCGSTKLNKLQKLQIRAARIVTNSPFDSSAASLIQDLGRPTTEELIHRETSFFAYKCLNKLAPD